MDIKLFGLAVTSGVIGVISAIAVIIIALMGSDPTVVQNGLWVWLMTIFSLVAELAVYISWKLKSKSTTFWSILDKLSIFMIIYAAILFAVNNLLYIVALAVVLYVWRDLYTEVGGITGDDIAQRLTLTIFARFLVRPVIGTIFLGITFFGGPGIYENYLINLFSSIIAIILAYITYKLKNELL